MIIRQLIYISSLIASFVFFILYPPWISWYLHVILLLLIPLDLLLSLPGMLSKDILMYAPPVVEKGADAKLILTTIHMKSYPVRCVIAKLHVTGDDFSAIRRIRCPGERDERREVMIDTSRSGVSIFEIRRIWTVSLIGLFALPKKVKIKEAVLIMPQPVKPVNTMALQHGIQLKPKPGGGFSEDHDIREYIKGDPIRSIHWKLSAKFNSLVIREPLVPPPHSRLVHVMRWKNTAEREITLGRLRWVSDYLLKWQMPFYVKYERNTSISEIRQETDLSDFLRNVLIDSTIKLNTTNPPPSRFSWIFRVEAVDIDMEPEDETGTDVIDQEVKIW